ncbi:MAG: VOC family protein [Thermoanaerobaculia bacterium]
MNLDHLLLGVADLDRGIAEFEKLTGVRAAYGGKHPRGTHNALAALGHSSYVELVAVQPGIPVPAKLAHLLELETLTPIGWAVAARDVDEIRSGLAGAGLSGGESKEGSRLTPHGTTLRWTIVELEPKLPEAPFFIAWAPDGPHPASTSPSGCTLADWHVAGPNGAGLDRLCQALELPVSATDALEVSMRLVLSTPRGNVAFETGRC